MSPKQKAGCIRAREQDSQTRAAAESSAFARPDDARRAAKKPVVPHGPAPEGRRRKRSQIPSKAAAALLRSWPARGAVQARLAISGIRAGLVDRIRRRWRLTQKPLFATARCCFGQ